MPSLCVLRCVIRILHWKARSPETRKQSNARLRPTSFPLLQSENLTSTSSTVHRKMPLHTLFGENIRSPAPQQGGEEEEEHPNPFDLAFNSQPTTNSDTSNKSSLQQNDRLTLQLQDSSRLERATSFSHGEPNVPPARRKGNPRVLFMGMRRYCGCVLVTCISLLMSSVIDVANHLYKRLCLRRCHPPRRCTSSPPPKSRKQRCSKFAPCHSRRIGLSIAHTANTDRS